VASARKGRRQAVEAPRAIMGSIRSSRC
jgi:hypothetical protein